MESFTSSVRTRVLKEMLGGISDSTGGGWKVLIMDDFTTRMMSSALKMSDILECNVSMVEDLHKPREPMQLVAVYFIQPTAASISRMVEDFEQPGASGLYPSVHVFFSSQAGSDAIARVKECPKLLKCIRTLKEGNVEFLTVDSRTMITDHPEALSRLMGDSVESDSRGASKELDSIAIRLSTFFSTIQEMPLIRYKAGRSPQPSDPPGSMARSTLTQRLAQKLYERNTKLQQNGAIPPKTSCDMIILDRSYDPVAPVIHEWTYEALVHDVLHVDGNVYKYETEMASGRTEEREMILDESDEIWRELRHQFIANVYATIGARFKEFQNRNKAAKATGSGKADMSTGSMKQLIQALPQFREILSRLSLHIQISSDIKSVTNDRQLTDVGEMEQDLVFREKNSKDLISFIAEHIDTLDKVDRMRLFMCYVGTQPEKMDDTKREQWTKLAKLAPQDMGAVCNLSYLGVQVMKLPEKSEGKGFFGSKKDSKSAVRTKRDCDSGFALFRFDPLMKNVISDFAGGRLSSEEYLFIQPASERDDDADSSKASSTSAVSARTGRSGINWAKRATEGPATVSGPAGASGRKLVIFVIGGVSRSEMRIVHEMSKSLGREIILGSTSVDSPSVFVDNLYKLSTY